MPQDPYSSIAKPLDDDPYAGIARPVQQLTLATSAPEQKSAPLRFVQSFNEGFGIPTSVQDKPSEAWQGIKTALQHPDEEWNSIKSMASGILPAQNSAYKQGKREITSPGWRNKIAGATHMVESGIPIIGPALVNADNKIGQGDVAGGLGITAATLAQVAGSHPQAPEMAGEAIDTAAAVPRVLGDAAKNKSYSMYNNVLGTKGRNTAFGANPGRGVAAEGIWGGKQSILDELPDAITTRAQQKRQVLGLPQNATKVIDATGAVRDPFTAALNDGVNGVTSDATLRRLQQTQQELTRTRSLGPNGEIRYGGNKNLTQLSPLQTDDLKSDIYGRTNYTNPELDEQVNNTLRQSGARVKGAIEDAVPEVKPFNQRLQDLYGAQTSLGKIVNNRMVSPTRSGFTEVAPSIIGEALGGGPGAVAMVAGREIGRMPAVRTGLAQGLYRVGKTLSPEEALTVPKPDFSSLTSPQPLRLPRGPMIANPSSQEPPSIIPPVTPTTRAQRLGLLLPEEAGGQITLQGSSLQSPFMTQPIDPTTRAERLNLLLPSSGTGKTPLGPTPIGSDLWRRLQEEGDNP